MRTRVSNTHTHTLTARYTHCYTHSLFWYSSVSSGPCNMTREWLRDSHTHTHTHVHTHTCANEHDVVGSVLGLGAVHSDVCEPIGSVCAQQQGLAGPGVAAPPPQ